jgi:hypothetical protein
MKTNFERFKKELDEAVGLIEKSQLVELTSLQLQQAHDGMIDTQSLLERCESACSKYELNKPIIRILHHFACSGGTLVSKCLATMPNVFVLSEVHPHSALQGDKKKPAYSPSDLSKLSIYAGVPKQKTLAEKIFMNSVNALYEHINGQGGTLILREHSHSDFCVGLQVNNHTVIDLLKEDFQIISLVTLRNPIDSYLALVANNWVHFQPENFDEYCGRLLSFLEPFSEEQITLYEDFVNNPQEIVEQMCFKLQIPFDDTFESIFDCFTVTGDSGRKGGVIAARKRRPVSDSLKKEIEESENFLSICEKYTFNSIVD